jgi:hypothetical protein
MTCDANEGREIYFDLQQIIDDECPTIIPLSPVGSMPRRHGAKIRAKPKFPAERSQVAERAWLES